MAGDTGIEHPALLQAGLGLVYIFLALLFLPDNLYSVLRFVIHPLSLVWLAMALPKMSGRIRFAFPFYALLLLQVWMVISMIATQVHVYKPITTGEYLWFPLELGMLYVLVIGLGGLMPNVTRYIINFFLLICTASAGIAVLQALHVGPAISIANAYVYRSIEGWDNIEGVRASGLSNSPNSNLLSLLVAAGFIAYKSARRDLRWYDYSMWGLFLVASFVAQHRSSMPLVALTFVVTTFILFRRRPLAVGAVLVTTAVLFLVTATVFKHNFAYTFETTWSSQTPQLRSRLEEERQAYEYFKLFPITGIGPSPFPEQFSAYPTNEFDIRVENLYYAILLTLGIPGLILVLTTYGGALFISLAYSLNRRLPRDARILMIVCAMGAVNLLWNGNVMVNITQYHVMPSYMILLAIGQLALTPRAASRRLRVSPYLQARDQLPNPLVPY
ncbi:MAG TPA: O-antigen ligase family protein [Fimbriimonadaceae bacterium]|nr:O-antigen ligase family protein [Fimbriimonadaceae bacterium]